jgi:hypothetical protein
MTSLIIRCSLENPKVMIAYEQQEADIAKSKVPSKKPKKMKAKGVRFRRKLPEIVIDQQAGLVFDTEKELYEFFQPQIDALEKEHQSYRKDNDLREEDIGNLSELLDITLDEPAEIWYDEKTFKDFPIFHFLRPLDETNSFHVAVTYVSSDDEPTFIFLHFVTKDLELVSKYRRGDLVYDRAFEEVGFGALEGDSLAEGDPMAIGLFLSMLKLRAEGDVAFEEFQKLGAECREETIESADEIWRSNDMQGNTLVTFIKEFPDHLIKDLTYVAITQEDPAQSVHSLLFSFPTTDSSLVDRYRHGENLQTEEVSQESSH